MHNLKYTALHKPQPLLHLFGIDLSKDVLTHKSLKTFVEGIFITSTMDAKAKATSVENYSSNIYSETERSSNGDLLIQTRFDVDL